MKHVWKESNGKNIFMAQSHLLALRSTCQRLSVGATIAKDNRICAGGYNGSVAGEVHCRKVSFENETLYQNDTCRNECFITMCKTRCYLLKVQQSILISMPKLFKVDYFEQV